MCFFAGTEKEVAADENQMSGADGRAAAPPRPRGAVRRGRPQQPPRPQGANDRMCCYRQFTPRAHTFCGGCG
eukprot:330562-Prorocentrum_minimum.AAC.1